MSSGNQVQVGPCGLAPRGSCGQWRSSCAYPASRPQLSALRNEVAWSREETEIPEGQFKATDRTIYNDVGRIRGSRKAWGGTWG